VGSHPQSDWWRAPGGRVAHAAKGLLLKSDIGPQLTPGRLDRETGRTCTGMPFFDNAIFGAELPTGGLAGSLVVKDFPHFGGKRALVISQHSLDVHSIRAAVATGDGRMKSN
jgi:hypothetical protein